MKTAPVLRLGTGVALALTLRSASLAQSTPAPDETVTLSPFTVNVQRDQGYIAVDSLAGGRTNTPIKFTPSAMSSLTRTFLDDLNLTNVRDALQWTLNVVPSDWYAGKQSSNPFNAWDYNFRGAGQSLQGGAGPMRNYFTFYQVADGYNIDRIETDRGPNSILFGIGTVGGVLSIYTKVPRLEKDFITGTATVDNYGSHRFELDTNQRLSNKLALRLNAVDDHRNGWRNGDRNHFQAVDLSLLFKPVDATTIRVEAEGGRAENTLISTTFPEAVSNWDGTTTSPAWNSVVATPGVESMKQWGPNNYHVWVAGEPDLGLQDWAHGWRSGGVYLPVAPYAGWYPTTMVNGSQTLDGSKIPVLSSRDFTFGSGLSRPSYEDLTAFVDQRIGDNLDAELSLYRYTDTQTARDYEGLSYFSYDLNQQLPDGSANPNFKKPFGDFFLSQQRQNRTVTEYRAQLNWHFDTTIFGVSLKQRFSAAAGDQRITWRARERIAQLVNGPSSEWTDNMVWSRLYLDQANTPPDLPASIDGVAVAYEPLPFDWFDFDETYKLQNASIMSQSLLWDDRISLILGARHDHYEHHRETANTHVITDDSASGTTYSAGGIYYFVPWLGGFVNYSKNFDPIGPGKSPSLTGQPLGPSTGSGYEYGLRLSTPDGKYYATINRYDTQSAGRITTSKIDLAGIWKQYYLASGQPADSANTTLSFDDTESLDVTGYEAEVTANPTRSLRLQAGYSKPDAKVVEAMSGQRAYYAANLATWNSAASGTSPDATTLKNLLTNAQTLLDNNLAGSTKTGLVKYTANVFANYTFLDGALKNFSAGAGVAQTGRQYLTTIGGSKWYSSTRTITSAVVAYEFDLRNIRTRIALNVDNLFNKRDPIITSYDGGWKDAAGAPIPNGWYFQTPITFRLSARLMF
ncbi:MAG TPA: TonB-dependent receptor plug domain-containing protein [Opitutus sp.]|nr:TonB-dependent receptor plug domain-containing protein [Opitutus sp.]